QVYDKTGTSIVGPNTFSSFMAGAGCAAPFDPNAIYDEENDRYILGVDNGGEDYGVAVSDDGNPLGNWWVYRFPTDVGGAFFDYPHAGVGRDAIYMGANMFNPGFVEARVWAFDKFAMYAAAPASYVTWSTGSSSTPQPMNLHGFAQGTWPVAGPHYILTDNNFDGNVYGVFSWTDPFGANVLASEGTVNLAAFTGIAAGFPIDVPQAGSAALLQANDWRVQDAEYRNGNIWMTSTISCNPGGGTVDCARWAQIDPTGPTVLNSGVIASPGEFRIFADLAVNDCDDMAVGYTKSSTAMFPSVFVTGRLSTDPVGTVQPEVALKAGEISYTAFDGSPHRWGDYSGMTIDPDGETFWYFGEYSKDTGTTNGRWGNYIGSFSFATCGGPPLSKRIDWGNDLDNDTIPDKVVEVGNSFPSIYQFTIEYFDPTGPLVQLKDVVPGYWNPVFQVAGPPCNVTRADERRNLFSDVFISCTPPGGEGSYSFVAGSRGTLDPGGAVEFEPSECGAFILNEGAAAFTGRSIHLGPTDPICLAAVRDINGGGLDYTGNGDEDGDGVSDYEEACVFDTDPCVP
ncbi:MAG TPA: hypothetical protein VLT88_09855, partial [Desulfosarcina sp.]|nr:hypothetical protein [Desulfosarcina sp.]